MLKNENIICISSIDWDFVWQGHQEIMSTFAKNGNRVLFIENTGVRMPDLRDIQRLKKRITNWRKSTKGLRKEADNLYIYSPLILPFPYSRIASWINKHILLKTVKSWMKTMEFHDPIIWTFLPTRTALDIINNVEKKLLIYYCIADFYELVDNVNKIKKMENELIRKSDLIFVQGEVLRKKCESINNNVHIFPFGVKIETFENAKHELGKTPVELQKLKRPIIGYIGGVHKHIDFKLLKYVAQEFPESSIVLVGPVQTDITEISNSENILLLGQKDFSLLPYYLNEFDVCIIPYLNTGYTATVYPTKLNEYHAMGKPVVSTVLPEVRNFNKLNDNLVLMGETYDDFVRCIRLALNETGVQLQNKRISSAGKNSWISKINQMSTLIENTIYNKSRLTFDWQKIFMVFYKKTQKKTLNIAGALLFMYAVVFYTPLVWFMANPLRIYQRPEKSDAIVVFAGGVGESGLAGQGYEERVQQAVELYKKGYARNIVFSSGYAFVYKEPSLMKVLATSLGVSKDAIVLEEKASNTYENVKFVSTILESKGWSKIILVSSPYHMLRASLVFRKQSPNINVTYTPIAKSIFYSHESIDSKNKFVWKRINYEQIRSLLHEYLGIIYYWFKGYI